MLTAQEKLEALAKLARAPSEAKLVAREVGVSEIMLHNWRKQFEAGEDLTDDVGNTPAPTPAANPSRANFGEAYPDGVRAAALAAYHAGEGTGAQIAERFGLRSEKTLHTWLRREREIALKGKLDVDVEAKGGRVDRRGRALAPGARTLEERRELVERFRSSGQSVAEFAAANDVHKAGVYAWIKDYEAGKLGGMTKKKKSPEERQRQEYNDHFKVDAAKRVLAGEVGHQVDADLGLPRGSVMRWAKAYRGGTLKKPKGPRPGFKQAKAAAPSLDGHAAALMRAPVDPHPVVDMDRGPTSITAIPAGIARGGAPAFSGPALAELAYWKAEAARWKAKAQKLIGMVMDDD